MTKEDNIVDLTPKPEKITPSQLEKVQKAVSDINRAQMEIGRLETQKHMLNHEVVKLQLHLVAVKRRKCHGALAPACGSVAGVTYSPFQAARMNMRSCPSNICSSKSTLL